MNGVLLGPQRLCPMVDGEIARLGLEGSVASITAGWQERETEDADLRVALRDRSINLELHRRGDEVFAEDPELFKAHRAKQDVYTTSRMSHRVRVAAGKERAGVNFETCRSPTKYVPTKSMLLSVRTRDADAHHLHRIAEIEAEFIDRHKSHERDAVARHREEIQTVVVRLRGGDHRRRARTGFVEPPSAFWN